MLLMMSLIDIVEFVIVVIISGQAICACVLIDSHFKLNIPFVALCVEMLSTSVNAVEQVERRERLAISNDECCRRRLMLGDKPMIALFLSSPEALPCPRLIFPFQLQFVLTGAHEHTYSFSGCVQLKIACHFSDEARDQIFRSLIEESSYSHLLTTTTTRQDLISQIGKEV
jgi:hypothetical protein